MTANPDDIHELLKLMRMDLSQLQARLTDLSKMVATLKLDQPRTWICWICGISCPSELVMLDHRVGVHDDPAAIKERDVAWAKIEALADE